MPPISRAGGLPATSKNITLQMKDIKIAFASPGEDQSFFREFAELRAAGSRSNPILVLCGLPGSKCLEAACSAFGLSDPELLENPAVFEPMENGMIVNFDGLVDAEDKAEFSAEVGKAVAFAQGGEPFYLVVYSAGWIPLPEAAEAVALRVNLIPVPAAEAVGPVS